MPSSRTGLPEPIFQAFTSIFAWSYTGSLQYFSVEPISDIQKAQDDESQLLEALCEFHRRKREEANFARNAATLSAAATIGVFSWPSTEKTFWLAKMFWNWALIASFFSLISSVQQRLLTEFPAETPAADGGSCHAPPPWEELHALLDLVLSKPSTKGGARRMSFRMIWIWQTSLMLMSYGWLFFLLGYALHILSPVFDAVDGDLSHMNIPMAAVTFGICLLMFANFLFCAIVSRHRLRSVRQLRELTHRREVKKALTV